MAIEIAELQRATSSFKSSRRWYRISFWGLYGGLGVVVSWFAARDGVVFVPRGADPANNAGLADSIAADTGYVVIGLLLVVVGWLVRRWSKKRMVEAARVLKESGLA